MQKLEWRAFHCCIGDANREDCAYEIGVRRKTVHENPKTWEGTWGGQDTKEATQSAN